MAGTFLNYPFDEEIFLREWGNEPDPVRNALVQSGVIVNYPAITAALKDYGNFGTIPYYKPLSGDPVNYDGQTDITVTETSGGHQSFVAYGRAKAWRERDFMPELVGNDPLGHIVRANAKYWQNQRQKILISVLEGVIANSDTGFAKHKIKVDRPSDNATLPGTINTKLAEVFGAEKGALRLMIMDAVTAAVFENLNLLEYRKGVSVNALLVDMRIGELMGYTVIVDDNVFNVGKQYIYVLGLGAILTGVPRLDRPVELDRDGLKFGGTTALITRVRDVLHPNGFSFVIPSSNWSESPTDAQLSASTSYTIKYPHKMIPIAKIVFVDSVTFTATADGASGATTSTKIDFVFSQDIHGLTASDITIAADTGAATKGALTGSGKNWSLAITGVSEGNVGVTIASKDEYTFPTTPATVAVYKKT